MVSEGVPVQEILDANDSEDLEHILGWQLAEAAVDVALWMRGKGLIVNVFANGCGSRVRGESQDNVLGFGDQTGASRLDPDLTFWRETGLVVGKFLAKGLSIVENVAFWATGRNLLELIVDIAGLSQHCTQSCEGMAAEQYKPDYDDCILCHISFYFGLVFIQRRNI